jgi:hypothetical protein
MHLKNKIAMSTKGIYIYGIVPSFYSPDMFRSLEHSGVYPITYQNISAIVSESNSAQLDSLDRESLGRLLVHHQKTIEELQSKEFAMFIPMRLGTIVQSKEEVIKILSIGHSIFIDTLKKIEYLIEIDLVVTWADFPKTLANISEHPDIIDLKYQIMERGIAPTQSDQVKIGMLMKEKLIEKNREVESNIIATLSSISQDIKMHEVMNDQMITNAAVLIKKAGNEQFEKIIDQLDEEFKGLLNFKLIGPLPCYSFYTSEIKKLNPEQVELAKIELALKDETMESDIKKAYLEKAKLFHPDTLADNSNDENFNRINKAYHTLLDYSAAVRKSSKNGFISLAKESVNENLILVKIK